MKFTAIGSQNYKAFSAFLSRGGISEDKLYIGVIEDDKAVGAGEFSCEGDLLVLDSLFVLEDYRRRGMATAMLNEFVELAKRSKATGIWTNYVQDEGADGFLQANGFLLRKDCEFYRVPMAEIVKGDACQAIFGKLKEKPEDKHRVISFAKLTSSQKNSIQNALFQTGLEDADEMIASLSDPANSIAVFKDADKKEIGAVLLTEVTGDSVTIKYLANIGGNPKDLIYLLKLFWGMVVARDMVEKDLVFCTAEQEIKQMMDKFAGNAYTTTGLMMVAYRVLM